VHEFLEGLIGIKGKFDDGSTFDTIMFVNLHGANKLVGKRKGCIGKGMRGKGEAYFKPQGFPHHTLPLKWGRWGVKEVQERYSKGGNYQYIHCDNSFKLFNYRNSSVSFSNYFVNSVEKKGSSKWSNTDCQYTEVSSFDMLQKMLWQRFVNGKIMDGLFDALDMKAPKAPPHRPKGSKNKPKPQPKVRQASDVLDDLKRLMRQYKEQKASTNE
jgi:hypothetical protein